MKFDFEESYMDLLRTPHYKYNLPTTVNQSVEAIVHNIHTCTPHQQLLAATSLESLTLWSVILQHWGQSTYNMPFKIPELGYRDLSGSHPYNVLKPLMILLNNCSDTKSMQAFTDQCRQLILDNHFNISWISWLVISSPITCTSMRPLASMCFELLAENEFNQTPQQTFTVFFDSIINWCLHNKLCKPDQMARMCARSEGYKTCIADLYYNYRQISLQDAIEQVGERLHAELVAHQENHARNRLHQGNNMRYNSAHSIHLLDEFRQQYIKELIDFVGAITPEETEQVDDLINKLQQEDAKFSIPINYLQTMNSTLKINTRAIKVSDFLKYVLVAIIRLPEPTQSEVIVRLKQELLDMSGQCLSGHINRLCIVLIGFVNINSVDIQELLKKHISSQLLNLSEDQQSSLYLKMVDASYDEDDIKLIMDMTESAYEEARKHDINEDMLKQIGNKIQKLLFNL